VALGLKVGAAAQHASKARRVSPDFVGEIDPIGNPGHVV